MHSISSFDVSFDRWKADTLSTLPNVSCSEIDEHFSGVLTSLSKVHHVTAKDCSALLLFGAKCTAPMDRVVAGCWEPGLCQEPLSSQCPSACTHEIWCKDTRNIQALNYVAFTIDFAKAILYKLVEELSWAQLREQVVFSTVAKLTACVLMCTAATFWADWKRSNRLVLWAWVITFSAPFVRSIIPTPILINWGPIDAQLERYMQVTDEHFDMTNRMNELRDVAGMICNTEYIDALVISNWQRSHKDLNWWCGKVDSGSTWFPWSSNLQKGAEYCRLVNNYLGIGDILGVRGGREKSHLCSTVEQSHMKITEGPLQGVQEVVDVGWLRSVAYSLVGTFSSALAFRIVLPEALSIAPGFLTGAIRIKIVVPQSYLPGVFITIMPLMYVPMVWSFCIFIVQGVGDTWLLIALVLLATSPLAYTFVGLARNIMSNISRKGIRNFTSDVDKIMKLMHYAAFLCIAVWFGMLYVHVRRIEESRTGIAYFLLEQGHKLFLPLLVGHISSIASICMSGPLWSIIFTFLTEMYMTGIVSADWMLSSAAEEWDTQGEDFFSELQESGMVNDARLAEDLHRQRACAMGALLDLVTAKSLRKRRKNLKLEAARSLGTQQ